MIDTSLFTVPIIPLPHGGMMHTPKTVPVLFDGEHVADAVRRVNDYEFRMFRGQLQQGISTGRLLIRSRFRDLAGPGTALHRLYLAVEIIPRLEIVE